MSTSYSPPVSERLTFGDAREALHDWPDYPERLSLGPEHVPDLIRLATDEDLRWADSDDPEVWAPVHAWRTLGQLRTTEAIEPLFGVLHEDDDWGHEELPLVYGMIGREAIPMLSRRLADDSENLWSRITAATSLDKVAAGDPSARGECVVILERQLEKFAQNDPSLNGFLVSYLLNLQARESSPLMERAFAADSVDLTIVGDWEDAQVELGLKAHRETPRPRLSLLWDEPEPEEPVRQEDSRKASAKKKKSKKKQAKASRKKNRKR